jgi:hypothetical protein
VEKIGSFRVSPPRSVDDVVNPGSTGVVVDVAEMIGAVIAEVPDMEAALVDNVSEREGAVASSVNLGSATAVVPNVVSVIGFSVTGVAVTDVSVTGAEVTGVSDTGVSDTGVSDTGVSVTGVSVTGVEVTGVSVTGVEVTGVSVTGVEITGVSVTGAEVTGVSVVVVVTVGSPTVVAGDAGATPMGVPSTGASDVTPEVAVDDGVEVATAPPVPPEEGGDPAGAGVDELPDAGGDPSGGVTVPPRNVCKPRAAVDNKTGSGRSIGREMMIAPVGGTVGKTRAIADAIRKTPSASAVMLRLTKSSRARLSPTGSRSKVRLRAGWSNETSQKPP